MLEDRDTWVDPATPQTIEALYESLTTLPDGTSAYFLLDAAFTPGLPQWLAQRWTDHEFCSLYAGRYTGQGIEAIEPYLVRLPRSVERRDALYADLIILTKGKPLLNCMLSELSVAQLAEHLQRQLESIDAKGNAFLLRFADTRSLKNLTAVLYPPQKRRMVHGISRWCMSIARDTCDVLKQIFRTTLTMPPTPTLKAEPRRLASFLQRAQIWRLTS